jgi:hypothetical protein
MFFLPLMLLFVSCSSPADHIPQEEMQEEQPAAPAPGRVGSIPLPKGYIRIDAEQDSYVQYLRRIPLKKDNTVYLYNGIRKNNQQAQYAVLDIDAGDKDLQQCADAVMRIRAEYLFSREQFPSIAFRFTNGFLCDYEHYAQGYRLSWKGNSCTWVRLYPRYFPPVSRPDICLCRHPVAACANETRSLSYYLSGKSIYTNQAALWTCHNRNGHGLSPQNRRHDFPAVAKLYAGAGHSYSAQSYRQ